MPHRISVLSQLVPPAPTWTAEKVPNQTGRVALITGAHRDVGREIARVLLLQGARVYIATCSSDKTQSVLDDLREETSKESVFLLELDLGNLDSIKAATEEFLRRETQLHTLYNNAAVSYAPADRETTQGYGAQFGTNVLGHFYLTKLLLPTLTATASASPQRTVRVINASSIVHYMAPREGIRWSTIEKGDAAAAERRKLGIPRLNGQSRLGNILFSNELARRFEDTGIVSISLYPGAINADFSGATTSILMRARKMVLALICFLIQGGDLDAVTDDVRHARGGTFDFDRPSGGRSNHPMASNHPTASNNPMATMGNISARAQNDPLGAMSTAHNKMAELSGASIRAITSLYAGTDPAAGELNGRYLTAWARRTLPHSKALDRDLAARLWEWCEDQVRNREPVGERVPVREEEPVQGEPVKAKEPAKEEPIKEEPVKEEPAKEEPAKEKEPVKEEEPVKEKEPVKEDEPVKEKEPVKEEPVKEKEKATDEDVKAKE